MSDALVGLTTHISTDGGFHETEDGWIYMECQCGWRSPPVPDLETLIDEAMVHTSLAVQASLAREGTNRPPPPPRPALDTSVSTTPPVSASP